MNEDEIYEVIKEEKSRGKRRPKDPEAKKRARELMGKFRRALDLETERDFLEAIREIEPTGDPEKQRQALWIWRAHRRALPQHGRKP